MTTEQRLTLRCQCCRCIISQDEADRGAAVWPDGIVTTVCEECAHGLKASAEADMTTIGTICHSDHDPADGVRVTLYRKDGDDRVWAAADNEEPYATDVIVGRESQA